MTDHFGKNYSKIWEAAAVYLEEKGWKNVELFHPDPYMNYIFGYMIDPLTEQAHRTDFALIVQGERDMFLMQTEPKIKQEWEESSKRIKEIEQEIFGK